MRNYFRNLRIPAVATRRDITDALELGSPTAKTLNPKHRKDAYQILLEEDQRQLYADSVTLYEAFSIASERLETQGGIDTHRWKARLADFNTAEDEIFKL